MRIGLVESINARPLTWGFEREKKHELIYSSPKVLSELLLAGQLDTALISSVEVLRNLNQLDYSRACGVCAREKVRSILFFKNKKELFPPHEFFVDWGSKTSVALFELLLRMDRGIHAHTIPTNPKIIQDSIKNGYGSHLLFGDNALSIKWDPEIFSAIDLAKWWNEKTGLYFIFALWAYPKKSPIEDEFFLNSLELTDVGIQEIINQDKRIHPQGLEKDILYRYLKEELHYIPLEKSWRGLELFEVLLKEHKIL